MLLSQFVLPSPSPMGFFSGSDGEESACNVGDPGVIMGREDPLEKEMAAHPGILAWRTHGHSSLGSYSSWGHKESDTTERLTHTPSPTYSSHVTLYIRFLEQCLTSDRCSLKTLLSELNVSKCIFSRRTGKQLLLLPKRGLSLCKTKIMVYP